jgi:hypothetical protein
MTNIADEYQGNMSSPLAGHAAWKQQHAQPMVPTSDVSAAILIGMRCVEARMFTAR